MNKLNIYATFGIVFLSSMLFGSGMYSNQIFAQNENEAEIEADIEQENKCKKNTECENENEINNQLDITTITGQQSTSLTVKKEIFGCNDDTFGTMDCIELPNNDPAWLSCTDSTITNNQFCQRLPENLFDIQVLGDQNIQLNQFEGSAKGTILENIQPGTYTINEIKYPGIPVANQLTEGSKEQCIDKAFPDGGYIQNTFGPTAYYDICIEYEDEQGNDCSTVTLAVGEEKTCIVKNYIQYANIGR